jgi:hypothetical protein
MNLVGLSLFEDKTVEDAVPQSPTDYNVTDVYSRDDIGEYIAYTYYPAIGWYSVENFDIEAGKAYWIKAINDFSLKEEI